MKPSGILSVCGLLGLLLNSSPAAAEFAGYAREVTGEVKITRNGAAEAVALHKGDDIAIGDKIETGKGASVRVEFADDSDLVVAQNGSLVIDKYVYDPKKPTEGKAEFSVLNAAFSYAGGWMGKGKDDSDVKVNLNFGSLGIRGTKLYRAMGKGECWIYLEKGAIDVFNQGGKVTLGPGEGTILSSTAKAPAAPHLWPKKERKWIRSEISGETSDWKP